MSREQLLFSTCSLQNDKHTGWEREQPSLPAPLNNSAYLEQAKRRCPSPGNKTEGFLNSGGFQHPEIRFIQAPNDDPCLAERALFSATELNLRSK